MADPSSSPTKPTHAALRWRRWATLGALTLLCYTLLGLILVPWLIGRQVTNTARDRLHRTATVARTRFNPFTLKATLAGLDLRDRDGTPLAAFDTLVLNLSLASLTKRALVLDEIRLVRPVVAVRIAADGKPAVADLLEPDPADTVAEPADSVITPPRLVVRTASIRDGVVNFSDLSRAPVYEERFEDLGLTVDGFSTLPSEEGGHTLAVSFASGAQLRWLGSSSFRPLTLEGRVNIAGVSLARVSSVLGGHLPLVLTTGTAGVGFAYQVTQAPSGALQVLLSDGTARVDSVTVLPRDSAEAWLRIPEAELQGIRIVYPDRAVHAAMLRVTDPWLRAARLADSTIDWTPLLLGLLPPTDSAAPPAEPWKAVVDSIHLTGGTASVEDRIVDPAARYELSGAELKLAPLSSDSTDTTSVSLSAGTGAGGSIGATGTFVRFPFRADLDVEAEGLQLPMVQPYLGSGAAAVIAGGTASGQGKLTLIEGSPSLLFEGIAAADNAVLNELAGDTLLAWRTMHLKGIRYTQDPDLLRIRSARLSRPFARIAISPQREVNLAVLRTLGTSADGTVADSAPGLPYEVLEIRFDDARIDFSDLSLILPFRAMLDSTTVMFRDVSSFGGTPGSMELAGHIEPDGVATSKGSLHLADPFAATRITASFRNVDMTRLTPYSATFAGYTIREGRMDVDIDYKVVDRQLEANHRIVASNLQLGEKVEGGGTPGFLVKLAVSLMKDRDGKIKLDAPMTGAVDDPAFDYSGMVWQAMEQVLGKVASAPFRFLGKLLGIGGDDPDLVPFEPGGVALQAPEREALDSVAAELGRRPELTIQVEGGFDSIADPAAARETALAARIAAGRDSLDGKGTASDTVSSALGRILESLYAERFSQSALDSLRAGFVSVDTVSGRKSGEALDATRFYAEVRSRLLAAEPLEPDLLQRLGRERAAAIVTALTASGTLDPSRVTVTGVGQVSRKKGETNLVPSELRMDAP